MPSEPPMPNCAAPPLRRRLPKLGPIALILLATLAAGWPIAALIGERETRQAGLRADFMKSWGPDQTVQAPVLVVPYVDAGGLSRHYLKIAPESLSTTVGLVPERRTRGLFSATVYTASVGMAGIFSIPSQSNVEERVGRGATILWKESLLSLEASALTGMTTGDHAAWDGAAIPWRNCGELIDPIEECRDSLLVARPPAAAIPAAGRRIPFQATMTLRGTGAFRHVLMGRQAELVIAAPWPTPGFAGGALPSDSTVTDAAFEARWRSVGYGQPSLWTASRLSETLTEARAAPVGVDLLEAVPTYRMIHRTSKYGILFVVLSFTVYGLMELLSVARIHAVQYGLLGASVTLFPLLLVSFAEPLGYAAGYGIGAAFVLTQASLYTAAVTRRMVPTAIFATALGGLFGFLYVLLSLETYSLLVGSVALFLVLSAVMAVTQRVDWRAGEG
ncbi:cell envelope integrity protein CreD (plasmid) [Azospirillum sp. TSH58]|nr:cell envelope integrity protein CreD [Azospirillum sp. TSH58]AWJ86398.1 cell envelope integrity protein CreD [Azospirillum sp. TSH58]